MPKEQTIYLKGMSKRELTDLAVSFGEKSYRGNQLFQWIYAKQASSFAEMSDISKEFREILEKTSAIDILKPLHQTKSNLDATTKFLFQLPDGLFIESVLIPPEADSPGAEKRLTVCVSTQVGCPLDCKFCATGTMGFARNLTAGEIVDQVIQIQRLSHKRISNIVYMGMGEPMLNYDNVMKSVELITSEESLNIGARHITISTAGYPDGIRRMAEENRKVKLALSLHSADTERRKTIMPITKKHSIEALVDALQDYYKTTRIRPTFEYILFDGFNDSEEDIVLLERLARKLPCKINVIPYHSISFTNPQGVAATLVPASRSRFDWFVQELRARNITVMIRSSAGEDINAACGQLAVEEKVSRRDKKPRPAG